MELQDHPPPEWIRKTVHFIDCVLLLVERFSGLALVLLVCWGAVRLIVADSRPDAVAVLKAVEENWKAVLIFLVPLFFSPIRAFLERIEEAWGMKAPKRPAVGQPATSGPIPITDTTSEAKKS